MTFQRFDAIILGGGPAGTVTAHELSRRGVSVLVCERNATFASRTGECLSPQAARLLKALKLDHSIAEQTRADGICAEWGSSEPHERHFIFEADGGSYLLDRARFDRSLAKLALASGTRWLGGVRLAHLAQQGEGWALTFVDKKKVRFDVSCQLIVDATGRGAWISRRVGCKRNSSDSLVAIIGVFDPGSVKSHEDRRLHVQACCDGWWYSSPLPDGSRLVTKFTDRDLVGHRESLLQRWRAEIQAMRLIRSVTAGRSFTGKLAVRCAATSITTPITTSPNAEWIAVGDAAATLDPISSHGISFAVSSGHYGARAAFDYLQGQADAVQIFGSLMQAHFNDVQDLILKYYTMEKRWQNERFWNRRHAPQ